MKQLIACCGFDCGKCDARAATMSNDDTLREKTARKWSIMNGVPEITADTINCTGCRTEGAKFGFCAMCEIRSCALGKGFETCGECVELDTCPTIGAIFANAPDAKNNLA
jgi:hypothetical protein